MKSRNWSCVMNCECKTCRSNGRSLVGLSEIDPLAKPISSPETKDSRSLKASVKGMSLFGQIFCPKMLIPLQEVLVEHGRQHEPRRDSSNLTETAMAEHHAVDGDRSVEEVADILSDACRGDSPSQNRSNTVVPGRRNPGVDGTEQGGIDEGPSHSTRQALRGEVLQSGNPEVVASLVKDNEEGHRRLTFRPVS